MKKPFAVLLLFVLYCGAGFAQGKHKPNVLLIYTDDQGTLDVNIYGAKDLYTPNIDKLAREGVRFTQFYAAAPICSPSRASLMTGRYPQRTGLTDNAPGTFGVPGGLPAEQTTMAEVFKLAGYTTAHIGKWHLGYSPPVMPNRQGFDYSFGFMGGCIDNYSHFYYWGGPNKHDLWRNEKEIWEDGQYFPDMTAREVNSFLDANRHKPFFIYWALNIPHYPLQGTAHWREYYKKLPSPRNKYAASVSTLDEEIGKVINKLKALGLAENTIVVFQSDHGHSEEERTFGGGGYAGPYRGSKFSLFEGGIRVPAIISWPGKLPPGEARTQMAANIDWLPTLAELCGIGLPEGKIDGRSLIPVIHSGKADSPHETFFWQSQGARDNPQWTVREGRWKLLHNPLGAQPAELNKNGFFLVDMQKDPSEQTNEADRHPDIVTALTGKYRSWITEVVQQ